MNIITKLTMEYLKKNKKRTAGTIVAITIVTILITILLIIFSSYQNFRENIVRSKGNWEAQFLCIKYSNALEITKDQNVKETSIWYDYGLSSENLKNIKTSVVRIHLWGYDENKIKNSGFHLIEGRMPETSDEIVIAKDTATFKLDEKKGINDKFEMTFEGETKTYTVVGIAEEIEEGTLNPNMSDGLDVRLGAITYLDTSKLQNDEIVYADIILKKPKNVYSVVQKLKQELNIDEIPNMSKTTRINRDELEKSENSEMIESMKQELAEMGVGYHELTEEEMEVPITTEKVLYNTELFETMGISNTNNKEFYTITLIRHSLYGHNFFGWNCFNFYIFYNNI